MPTLEEVLAKSREIEEKHKQFLERKKQMDKSMAETDKKIQKAMNSISDTKNTIHQIDELYERLQKVYEKSIDQAIQKIGQNKLMQVGDPDFQPDIKTPKQVGQIIRSKSKVLFLTGAGMSAGSGIPTFRGAKGYWAKNEAGKSNEQILTLSHFKENEFETWDWLENFYVTKLKHKHNKGHSCLDQICLKIKQKKHEAYLITQNIDNYHHECQNLKGAHQKSPYNIHEIHGNILKIRCQHCTGQHKKLVTFPYEQFRKTIIGKRQQPKCPSCKNFLRPHIMFFDEYYPQQISKIIEQYVQECDLLVVIGTALKTGMARSIVNKFISKEGKIVEINPECEIRQKRTVWIQGKSETVLPQLMKYI